MFFTVNLKEVFFLIIDKGQLQKGVVNGISPVGVVLQEGLQKGCSTHM